MVAAGSRRMLRTPWAVASSDEEARAYLQLRLAMLFRGMFWSLAGLIAFLCLLYQLFPEIAPRHQLEVYALSAVGLGAMAVIWRWLVRRPVPARGLQVLDLVYCVGIGASFGASAFLQSDLRPAGYLSVIYGAFTVFARALVLPSTGARTAVASTIVFVPIFASAVALALTTPQELPGPAYAVGACLLGAVPIVLAAAGSHIIYGLRRKVTAAQQLGSYKLVRKIGEGGMGAVHLAHHVLLRRPTAIKLLQPDRVGAENLERFEREVQHMSQLSHPNTVAVFDYGHNPDGVFYYAMEYLAGIDLENLVRKHGRQPAGRVVPILAQVCGALQEAHDAKLIHRDIKPANIILCERGGMPDVAKVVDFGLVKEITADTGASTQVILGTPAYIAPEAVTDPSTIGPAVDLYALGCVGYFLLTGKRVFEGKTTVEVCIQHVTAAPRPPSSLAPVSPELDAIILKCLSKRPDDRYPSAAALAAALRALPPTPDWDRAEARRWWRDFAARKQAASAASSSPTLTITVDLGHRDVRST